MKTKKRRYETYSFYDHTGISAHLEKMARKGWMLEEITSWTWVYRKIQPAALSFAVSYYPQASQFDPKPSQEQETFYDFCAHTGWKLACSSAQMQIFYNESLDPLPLETDPVLEVDTIHKAAVKTFLPAYFVLMAVALLQIFLLFFRIMNNPIQLLANSSSLFGGFAWCLCTILCLAEIGGYFRWHRKAKKAAEYGEFTAVSGHSQLTKAALILTAAGFFSWILSLIFSGNRLGTVLSIAMILYMVTLIGLVNAIRRFLQRRGASTKVNRTVTILSSFILSFGMMGIITALAIQAVSHGVLRADALKAESPPFTMEDLRDVSPMDYTQEETVNESFLLKQLTFRQYPSSHTAAGSGQADEQEIEYTVTSAKLPFLYELCRDSLLRRQNVTANRHVPEGYKSLWEPTDGKPWMATEAYRLTDQDSGARNTWLLCYGNHLVWIFFSWEPSVEQMEAVGEKFLSFS